MLRTGFLYILTLPMIWTCCASAATQKDVDTETACLEREVRALAALRDSVAAALPATGAPGYRDGCFALTMEGAAASGPMTVYLVRRNGEWKSGMATQPQAAPGASAGAVDLVLDAKRLSGTFDVTLRPVPHVRHYPTPGPRTYRYQIDLLAEGGTRQGTAVLVSAGPGNKLSDPLPAPIADGPQQWHYVAHWRVAGPIPFKPRQPFYPANLPAAVLAEDSPPRGGAWDDAAAEPVHGSIRLPVPRAKGQPRSASGAPPPSNTQIDASYFAYSTLNVAQDCEVWAAMHVNDSVRLWIDDRLAWVSGEHAWRNRTDTHVFRLKIEKGTRQLCVRVDNRHRPCLFGLLFCTAGAPRSVEQYAAAQARHKAAMAKLTPPIGGVTGWRGDATGTFPGTTPVTAWNQAKGINVLWRHRKLKSSGTPVIVGDRMLVNQRPFYVECIDKMKGDRLWMHDCDPLSVVDPETFRKAVPLKQEALKLSGDALAAQDKKLAPFYDKKHGLKPLNLTGEGVVVDEMFPTPVTDGKRIWVLAQERVIVCLDLDGKRLWATDTGSTSSSVPVRRHGCSPATRSNVIFRFHQGRAARGTDDVSTLLAFG